VVVKHPRAEDGVLKMLALKSETTEAQRVFIPPTICSGARHRKETPNYVVIHFFCVPAPVAYVEPVGCSQFRHIIKKGETPEHIGIERKKSGDTLVACSPQVMETLGKPSKVRTGPLLGCGPGSLRKLTRMKRNRINLVLNISSIIQIRTP
jgi:hypothetical protein